MLCMACVRARLDASCTSCRARDTSRKTAERLQDGSEDTEHGHLARGGAAVRASARPVQRQVWINLT